MADADPPERNAFVFDAAKARGYVLRAQEAARRVGAGDAVLAELADMAERLDELHMAALVAAGWCASAKCSAELTDPAESPSGARHCRTCRIGWTLAETNGRLRAIARPWPAPE